MADEIKKLLTTGERILDWQRRFQEQPKIWHVEVDGHPGMGYYATKEGAEMEWRHFFQKGRVVCSSIHTDELAHERWVENFQIPPDMLQSPA